MNDAGELHQKTHRFFRLILLMIALLIGGVGATYAFDQSLFAPVTEPIGVANRVRMLTSGAEYRMFVTRPYDCPSEGPASAEVIYFNPTDTEPEETVFATLNTPAGEAPCPVERYIEVSPGFGGFASYRGHVFVTWGRTILRIPPDGCSGGGSDCVVTFTTMAACTGSHTGVTFDPWGAFGYNMIVTCNNGKVFKVTSGGVATQLADLGTAIQNPGVAHPNFGSCGGCIFVAAEAAPTGGEDPPGKVYFIRPNGTSGVAVNWPLAEAIHPIPPNVCNFGTSGGAFFTAIFAAPGENSTGIYQFPKTAFTVGGVPLNGNILVTSEPGAIGLLKPSGTGYAITQWHEDIGQNEGGDFCARVTLPPGQVKLNGSFNPNQTGKYRLRFFSSVALNFFPLQIDTETLRAGRIGNEDSLSHCTFPGDVNKDGIADLDCHFFMQLSGFNPSGPRVRRVFWSAFTLGSSPSEDPPLDGFGD